MGTLTTERKRLKKFRQALECKVRLQELWLFGSRARGKARPDSDYDLILVSTDFDGVPWRDRALPCMETWDFNIFNTGADFLCYTPEEFKKKQQGLNVVSIAVKEGIRI